MKQCQTSSSNVFWVKNLRSNVSHKSNNKPKTHISKFAILVSKKVTYLLNSAYEQTTVPPHIKNDCHQNLLQRTKFLFHSIFAELIKTKYELDCRLN